MLLLNCTTDVTRPLNLSGRVTYGLSGNGVPGIYVTVAGSNLFWYGEKNSSVGFYTDANGYYSFNDITYSGTVTVNAVTVGVLLTYSSTTPTTGEQLAIYNITDADRVAINNHYLGSSLLTGWALANADINSGGTIQNADSINLNALIGSVAGGSFASAWSYYNQSGIPHRQFIAADFAGSIIDTLKSSYSRSLYPFKVTITRELYPTDAFTLDFVGGFRGDVTPPYAY